MTAYILGTHMKGALNCGIVGSARESLSTSSQRPITKAKLQACLAAACATPRHQTLIPRAFGFPTGDSPSTALKCPCWTSVSVFVPSTNTLAKQGQCLVLSCCLSRTAAAATDDSSLAHVPLPGRGKEREGDEAAPAHRRHRLRQVMPCAVAGVRPLSSRRTSQSVLCIRTVRILLTAKPRRSGQQQQQQPPQGTAPAGLSVPGQTFSSASSPHLTDGSLSRHFPAVVIRSSPSPVNLGLQAKGLLVLVAMRMWPALLVWRPSASYRQDLLISSVFLDLCGYSHLPPTQPSRERANRASVVGM